MVIGVREALPVCSFLLKPWGVYQVQEGMTGGPLGIAMWLTVVQALPHM